MSKIYGDSNQQFRNIQERLSSIREALDVIEGNLIDYVDDNTSDNP